MSAVRAASAILVAGLCLCACQAPMATLERTISGDPAKPYLGMTKDQVIACAGKPSGSYGTTSGETLVYHYSGAGPVPSAAKEKPDQKNPFAKSKSEKNWDCSASLSFEGGQLTRVNFAPRGVVSPYEKKKDPKTGEKVTVTPPPPCNFSLPNCSGR
jgi:hypothetical protein